jgi:DNA-binding LacI/PurR family transcriptional regulator
MDDQPSPERATVVTLARLAGVAASTVSRALKGDVRISPETRRRIVALASAHGYQPNVLARTLSSGRSGLVGLVLGPVENPFYADLMEEAVAQSALRGLRLMLLHAGGGPIEDRTTEALLQYKVDGCLISSAELSSRAAQICAAHDVPVVMVNRVPRLHASAVACDNRQGAEVLADLLLAAGHATFAIIKGNADTSTSIERERGFAERVSERGGEVLLRVNGGSTYDGGFSAGRMFAEMPAAKRPHAIFSVADIMAMGVMDALRIAGVATPGDISVVGFDGIAAAARPIYSITTVAQPLRAMIGRGLDMLTARIGAAGLPDEVVTLRGELVVRRSARLAP